MKKIKAILYSHRVLLFMAVLLGSTLFGASTAHATASSLPTPIKIVGGRICGSGSKTVRTSIDLGCRGQDNPIIDMLFAFTRFLSVGVGIVVVGSIIVAGIQYTTSRGDPQATEKAIHRVSRAVGALALYILGFALLNFLVPGGLF